MVNTGVFAATSEIKTGLVASRSVLKSYCKYFSGMHYPFTVAWKTVIGGGYLECRRAEV